MLNQCRQPRMQATSVRRQREDSQLRDTESRLAIKTWYPSLYLARAAPHLHTSQHISLVHSMPHSPHPHAPGLHHREVASCVSQRPAGREQRAGNTHNSRHPTDKPGTKRGKRMDRRGRPVCAQRNADNRHSTHRFRFIITAPALTVGIRPGALGGPQAVLGEVPRAVGMRLPLERAHGVVDRPRQPPVDVPEAHVRRSTDDLVPRVPRGMSGVTRQCADAMLQSGCVPRQWWHS